MSLPALRRMSCVMFRRTFFCTTLRSARDIASFDCTMLMHMAIMIRAEKEADIATTRPRRVVGKMSPYPTCPV
jgi:hypothetical protein